MDVITIECDAFRAIIERINNLESRFAEIVNKANYPLSERWLTNEEACKVLDCCKRTLQTYRDERKIPFTAIGHRYYYRAADIEKLFNKLLTDLKGF